MQWWQINHPKFPRSCHVVTLPVESRSVTQTISALRECALRCRVHTICMEVQTVQSATKHVTVAVTLLCSGHGLSWLRFSWFFSVPPGQCLDRVSVRPNRFLPDRFQLTSYPTILRYIVCAECICYGVVTEAVSSSWYLYFFCRLRRNRHLRPNSVSVVDSLRMMNWKWFGRKWSWPDWGFIPPLA
jgi:hypothetical protein